MINELDANELDKEIVRLQDQKKKLVSITLTSDEEKFFDLLSDSYFVSSPTTVDDLDLIEDDLYGHLEDIKYEISNKTNLIKECEREIKESKVVQSKLSKHIDDLKKVSKHIIKAHNERIRQSSK